MIIRLTYKSIFMYATGMIYVCNEFSITKYLNMNVI